MTKKERSLYNRAYREANLERISNIKAIGESQIMTMIKDINQIISLI